MSRFPKSARHPDIHFVGDVWRERAEDLNTSEESHLDDLPELQLACTNVVQSKSIDYIAPARGIVYTNALRVMSKGFEALDALATCNKKRINLAAMVQCYGAAFFFARAFCLLMGFAPANRGSNVTLDVFGQTDKQRVASTIEGMKVHKYERWGHDEVWQLTQRLVNTLKVPEPLTETKRLLRRSPLRDMSKLRNSFSYDDSKVSPLPIAQSDFPDIAEVALIGKESPDEFKNLLIVIACLVELSRDVVVRSGLERHLYSWVSSRRVAQGLKMVSIT